MNTGANGKIRYKRHRQLPCDLLGYNKQMNVIGHQTISINLYAEDAVELGERFQVAREITRFGKHHLAVVSALDEVIRM